LKHGVSNVSPRPPSQTLRVSRESWFNPLNGRVVVCILDGSGGKTERKQLETGPPQLVSLTLTQR